MARLAGFLLAALLALSVPGTTRDHVDGVFDLHSHDPITGQTVPLVDERGHPTGSQAVSRGIAATPGLFVHAPAAPAAALGEIVLGAIVALAAVLPLAFPVTRDTIRRPLGAVFRPVPPPPRLQPHIR